MLIPKSLELTLEAYNVGSTVFAFELLTLIDGHSIVAIVASAVVRESGLCIHLRRLRRRLLMMIV